ncbi:MAG: type III toxin-antitoxin system ToxN/AbiQ family toxin [Clostridiales bacterium]|nr:type III toxin-antitoxin system ToxN/AbiQ family toxin [Clostridiales bacterium]
MDFYNIKDEYIRYLRGYDSKVLFNKKESRPYIGIVLSVNEIQYYAPLTSPKPKHIKMRQGKDFRKIGGGRYGAINFNNMIPVPDEVIIKINIREIADEDYRRLLQNQYREIQSDTEIIKRTAEKLRDLVYTSDEELSSYDRQIKNRCCNFSLLEAVYMDYKAPAIEEF